MYRISPDEIHGSDIGYTYNDSIQLVREIVKENLDYIHLSLGDYASQPEGSNKSYTELFSEVLDADTKLIIVGGVFDVNSAKDAVENYAGLIAIGRGTLIDPKFAAKVMTGKGDTIIHEIEPGAINHNFWPVGLREIFTTEGAFGVPPLPNGNSILQFHTGKYDGIKNKPRGLAHKTIKVTVNKKSPHK